MNPILQAFQDLRDTFNNNVIFSVGILLVCGYFLGLALKKIKLPAITGYIIAGLLMGDSVTGLIHAQMSHALKTITEVALGLIALTIGGEFLWIKIKRMGKEVIIMTVFQLLLSFGMVTLGLVLFRMELPFALMLGAIASATAPAATVAIVQSLGARGLFVDYLYGIVALDDAGCVILFGVIFAFTSTMLGSTAVTINQGQIILHAFREVGLSLVLGAASGAAIHYLTIKKQNTNEIMIVSLGAIFLTIAAAIILHLSPLLTNMTAGAVLINLSARNHRIFRILEPLIPTMYALFFLLAGTELKPAILADPKILLYGGIYILFRAIGKYSGVFIGGLAARVQPRIRNYLGFSMLPQAGVAIGLVLTIQASPMVRALALERMTVVLTMVNIVLFSVFINELIGPPLSRMALIRGNDMEVS